MTQAAALRQYTLLADGERGAVVDPAGEFAWMCFPAWADDARFTSLLGGRGCYGVKPAGRFTWGGGYEQGSLIWRHHWNCMDGILECREALAFPGETDQVTILRQVRAVAGTVDVEVKLEVAHDYGTKGPTQVKQDEDGHWRGRSGDCRWVWSLGDGERAELEDGVLRTSFTLAEGEHRDLVLVLACREDPPELPDADRTWAGTETAWQEEVPELADTVAPRDARHAYAVLRGMTCAEGGMVAAATTSLPERAREGRAFDYRYAWIRDQCLTGQAIAGVGPLPLLDDAVQFVSRRLLEHGADLAPAYTVAGERVPDEEPMGLPGFPGGADIRGNHVNDQFQLDSFGDALLLFADADRHGVLGADGWRAAEIAAEAIEARWTEPDAGIWELEPDHWTHSRLMAAAGLKRIAGASAAGGRAPAWLALSDRIVAETSSTALHPTGRWQRSPTDERVDAALLLPAVRGLFEPGDPRSIATLRAVQDDLVEDGYLYRYRPDPRPLGDAEGAFLLCGFMLCLALQREGETVAAARWFERNRAASGSPGLLAEEFDVRQRQLRGNLPQAFVHALLLQCAVALKEPVAGGPGVV